MKNAEWYFIPLFTLTLFAACSTPRPTSSNPEPEATSLPPIVVEAPSPIPTWAGEAPVEFTVEAVVTPACASYRWDHDGKEIKGARGRAPMGFLVGTSQVRDRAKLRIGSVAGQPLGDPSRDSLAHYAPEFKRLGIPLDTYEDRVRATYLLLLGLGMRESSGNYSEGWDASATSPRTASNAEAGLYQISYDSRNSDKSLPYITAEYANDHADCMLDVFKVGAKAKTGRNSVVAGSGPGAAFQRTMKNCPAWATEFAAVLVRVNGGAKGHFGPIRRKEAELRKECYQ